MQVRCEKCSEWFKAHKMTKDHLTCKCGHDNTRQVLQAFQSAGVVAVDISLKSG